jgi:hypothetical protein
MVQVCKNIDRLAILLVRLVGESVWYSFVIVLDLRYRALVRHSFSIELSCVPTLPCSVFKRVSRFLMLASATETETEGPVADPVA